MTRLRFTVFAFVLAFALPAPAYAAPAAHVYFVRGFMDMFSLGLDQMAEQVRARGITATVHSHTDWARIADNAANEYRDGTRSIVFVGHSMGASAAIQAAEALQAKGIPVRLIVTLDPSSPASRPANVSRIVNLYFPSGMGNSIGGKGAVTNIKLPDNSDIGHFSMDKAPRIQKQVLSLVLAASGNGRRSAR